MGGPYVTTLSFKEKEDSRTVFDRNNGGGRNDPQHLLVNTIYDPDWLLVHRLPEKIRVRNLKHL